MAKTTKLKKNGAFNPHLKYERFSIELKQITPIDFKKIEDTYVPSLEEEEHDYNPFSFESIQYYSPIHSELFDSSKLHDTSVDEPTSLFPVVLSHRNYFIDPENVYDTFRNTISSIPSHIKFSPLIDNLNYLTGKYDIYSMEKYRPASYPINDTLDPKMNSYHNMSHVDCFFNYLTNMLFEKHHFIHGIQFYGSCSGIQRVFKSNISDDIEYLNNSDFFMSKMNDLFTISKTDVLKYVNMSCKNRPKLCILDDNEPEHIELNIEDFPIENIDIDIDTNVSIGGEGSIGIDVDTSVDIVDTRVDSNIIDMEVDTIQKEEDVSNQSTDSSDTDSDSDSELNYSTDNENESGDEDEDPLDTDKNEDSVKEEDSVEADGSMEDVEEEGEEDNSDPPDVYAYIKNYPIQMIYLEKLEGTLDSLFESESEMDEDRCLSMSMQIIMILTTYQKAFHFTHNDLHTNNIMYITTDEPFIYYRYNHIIYRVPTYGKIYKIIDFGRSIYTFDGKIFCSDCFSKSGDACTQYNFGPFVNPNKPRIEPNYSFDLCRLGCSIYDFVIDSDEDTWQKMDRFQRLVYRWCMDDNDKNVLYKKNGDERYPDFKLYKMIARTVHKHNPTEQLDLNVFKSYISKISMGELFTKTYFIDIDKIPCYV